MVYRFDGFNYLIRLDKGERLSEALNTFVGETKIEGAWVNALGAALEMTLGYYHLDKQEYEWRTFSDGPYEIAGLTGNIAFDEQGKMVFHLHGTFGDREYRSVSGHVKDLTAAATVELFVHRAYQPINRKPDPNVGLSTLDL
jgi:predicted DNA-binding protein with PD1-like motif